MSALSIHDVPNGVIVAGAVVAALGVIWRKVVVPVRAFVRGFKAWMDRIETAVNWVDAQMKTNGGSTLVDKVNTTAEIVEQLDKNVSMLLTHDAERDTEGKRYGTNEGDQ